MVTGTYPPRLPRDRSRVTLFSLESFESLAGILRVPHYGMGRASATFDELKQLSATTIVGGIFTLWIAYLAGLAIYRLYFHPLAKFPGPKLAALTKYYEMYYEVALRGQFTFHFKELHEKYGSPDFSFFLSMPQF